MSDKADNVDYLPIWKKGSTAEEWLLEIAAVARKRPERFGKAVIVFEETLPNGNTRYDYYCRNTNTIELVGLLEFGKIKVNDYTSR